MSASFYFSGVVTLSDDHHDFFEVLGIPSSLVMTSEQFQACIHDAERVLLVMTDDPYADPLFDSLAWRILADIDQQFFAVPWLACVEGPIS
jgi:hypothetical protein